MSAIPFEKQTDQETNRMCGAACLAMVYRSFGKEIGQAEIWPAIAKVNRFGRLSSTTHLMTKDALARGFAAVAVGARYPLQALRLCHENGIRVVLNQRSEPGSARGHYTVLTDLDETSVLLHDPYFGPGRRLSHAELLQLWQPNSADSEIAGGVLIAITDQPAQIPPCQFCHASIPPSFQCPKCQNPVSLLPAAVLGCVTRNCIARMWNYVCCPTCDTLSDFDGAPPQVEGTESPQVQSAGESAPAEPASLNQMFEALEKFCQHLQTAPGAAANAELQQQLQQLSAMKGKLRLSLAEANVYTQAHRETLAAFVQNVEKQAESHRQKAEQANAPAPTLDGRALGRALLKDLGFSA